MQRPGDADRLGRVKVWLTREGTVYLVILLFVAAGALLRNINLLLLMTGIMIAPLFLSWRASGLMLRYLSARRSLPRPLFAGQTVQATWKVSNHRSVLPTWSLQVEDRWQRSESSRSTVRIRAAIARIRPGETSYGNYQIHFPQRGQFEAGPARLSTRFPFGLMTASIQPPETSTVRVAPSVGKLSAAWDRRLSSHASGSEAIKRRRGAQDEEFFGLRQYRSGDSRRDIHWRATARSSQLMVKQFDSRSDRDFVLLLDLWIPPGEARQERELAERGLSFVATVLTGLAAAIRGKVAIAVCGSETVVQCDVNSPQLRAQVWDELAIAQPAREPELVPALERIFGEISGGTPIYVVSTRPRPLQLEELFVPGPLAGVGSLPERLSALEPWIRWLEIDSPDFGELFELPENLRAGEELAGVK